MVKADAFRRHIAGGGQRFPSRCTSCQQPALLSHAAPFRKPSCPPHCRFHPLPEAVRLPVLLPVVRLGFRDFHDGRLIHKDILEVCNGAVGARSLKGKGTGIGIRGITRRRDKFFDTVGKSPTGRSTSKTSSPLESVASCWMSVPAAIMTVPLAEQISSSAYSPNEAPGKGPSVFSSSLTTLTRAFWTLVLPVLAISNHRSPGIPVAQVDNTLPDHPAHSRWLVAASFTMYLPSGNPSSRAMPVESVVIIPTCSPAL